MPSSYSYDDNFWLTDFMKKELSETIITLWAFAYHSYIIDYSNIISIFDIHKVMVDQAYIVSVTS